MAGSDVWLLLTLDVITVTLRFLPSAPALRGGDEDIVISTSEGGPSDPAVTTGSSGDEAYGNNKDRQHERENDDRVGVMINIGLL